MTDEVKELIASAKDAADSLDGDLAVPWTNTLRRLRAAIAAVEADPDHRYCACGGCVDVNGDTHHIGEHAEVEAQPEVLWRQVEGAGADVIFAEVPQPHVGPAIVRVCPLRDGFCWSTEVIEDGWSDCMDWKNRGMSGRTDTLDAAKAAALKAAGVK